MSSQRTPITSSELANLWMAYQEKTMIIRILDHFIEHADDEAKQLTGTLIEQETQNF